MSDSTTTTINSSWHQHRSYAVSKGPRAPLRKPPRAPKLAPSQSQPQSKPNFDLSQITKINQILTPEVFEKGIQRCDGIVVDTLAPEDYYKHAMDFLEAVLKGVEPGRANLAAIGISPETAHDMGCLLYRDSSWDIKTLGRTLFACASAANYTPSTITLARFLFRTDYWGHVPEFKHVENRFMKLVYEGKDCNALAVYGENLFMSRKYAAAVPILNQAISVDDGIFEWKGMCMLCLAKSYARLGKIKAAEDVLEDLGDPDAWVELGPLLDRGGLEDKRQWLLREGFRGKMGSYRELAEIDFEKASKATNKAEKREHNLWAMEWSRLADPKAQY